MLNAAKAGSQGPQHEPKLRTALFRDESASWIPRRLVLHKSNHGRDERNHDQRKHFYVLVHIKYDMSFEQTLSRMSPWKTLSPLEYLKLHYSLYTRLCDFNNLPHIE